MDDSCRRPGSIPFKWEIKPGTPKPHYVSSMAAAASYASPKLNPPPCMASPSPSQSPIRHLSWSRYQSSAPSSPNSATGTTIFYRSASASPSRRRGRQPPKAGAAGAASPMQHVISVPPGCFPVPSLKRVKDQKRSMSRNANDAEKAAVFAWARRSAASTSTRSRSSVAAFASPLRGSVLERDEVEVAARWFF